MYDGVLHQGAFGTTITTIPLRHVIDFISRQDSGLLIPYFYLTFELQGNRAFGESESNSYYYSHDLTLITMMIHQFFIANRLRLY
jgi:hypothetical protein